MKKTYIAPAVVNNKVTIQLNILTGSFSGDSDENLNNVTIDTTEGGQGDGQLTKQENLWDTEW